MEQRNINMSQKSKPQLDIKRTILTAVRNLGDYTGVSLDDIEHQLSSIRNNVPNFESIWVNLNDALDKVLQTKDANENDKIKETARWAEDVTGISNLNMDSDLGNVGVPAIADIEKTIITAVHRLGSPNGASLDDIKCHLFSITNNIPDLENIQLSLNNAVDKGLLSKLTNEKYKIKKTENQMKEIFPKAKSAVDKELQSTLANGKDKRIETAICSDDAAQHVNVKTSPDPRNVGVRAATSFEEVMTAIRHLGSSNDLCSDDIEKLLFSILKNAPTSENTRLSPNNAVDEGLRSKLTNGKYEIKKTENGAAEIIQNTKSTEDKGHQSTLSNGKDKFKETARYSEEIAQQTNVKACSDPENVDVPAATSIEEAITTAVPHFVSSSFVFFHDIKRPNNQNNISRMEVSLKLVVQDENLNTKPDSENGDMPGVVDIEKAITTAVRNLDGTNGVSLNDIERYLSSILNNVPDLESICWNLNNAVEKGLVSKLNNGKYKIKDTEKYTEIVQDKKSDADKRFHSKMVIGTDKIKEISGLAEEEIQGRNLNSDLDPGNDGISAEEDDASIPEEKIKTIKTTTIKKIKTTTIKTITTTTNKTITTTSNKKTMKRNGKVKNV